MKYFNIGSGVYTKGADLKSFIFAQCDSTNDALLVRDELNRLHSENEAMRDVVEAACKYVNTEAELSEPAYQVLENAVNKMRPTKTIEQLSDEVISAAIVWDTNPTIATAQALKDASKAWLKLKNEAALGKQS